jgi:hypothetical protein
VSDDDADPSTELPVEARLSAQRQVVYALTAMLALAGLVLVIALDDPCNRLADPVLRVGCRPSLADRIPRSPGVYLALAAIVGAIVVAYELRWSLRAPLAAVAGLGQLVVATVAGQRGMSAVLVVTCVLTAGALVAAAVGVQRNQRPGWAVAATTCGVLTVVYFFGAPKLAAAAGWPLWLGVLPALAVLLPTTVALATSAPGAPVNVPFRSRPRA